MGISKDRAQYVKQLIAAGIIEDPMKKHIGCKSWRSGEENLAKDVYDGLSDRDSFILIPEDVKKTKS